MTEFDEHTWDKIDQKQTKTCYKFNKLIPNLIKKAVWNNNLI